MFGTQKLDESMEYLRKETAAAAAATAAEEPRGGAGTARSTPKGSDRSLEPAAPTNLLSIDPNATDAVQFERPPPPTPLAALDDLSDAAFFAGLSAGLDVSRSAGLGGKVMREAADQSELNQQQQQQHQPPPGTDDSIELVYNQILNCYYDPKTGKFYQLRQDEAEATGN